MHSFKDAVDRNWQVPVNVASVKRVKEALGVDLLQCTDAKANVLERLANDPVLLVDVLFILCQDQAATKEVTDVQFGESLWGEALDRATDAFLEALTDFFPRARRGVLKQLLTKFRDLETKAATAATDRLKGNLGDRLLAKELAKIDREIEQRLSGE
jgi:hypothetical protein